MMTKEPPSIIMKFTWIETGEADCRREMTRYEKKNTFFPVCEKYVRSLLSRFDNDKIIIQ